jgi:hypothetical protein
VTVASTRRLLFDALDQSLGFVDAALDEPKLGEGSEGADMHAGLRLLGLLHCDLELLLSLAQSPEAINTRPYSVRQYTKRNGQPYRLVN